VVPKVVLQALFLLVGTALATAGVWLLALPDAAVRHLPEFSEDNTPDQARRAARITGGICLLFAYPCFHLVLVQGFLPVKPGDTLDF
jgi:hypothetical protein